MKHRHLDIQNLIYSSGELLNMDLPDLTLLESSDGDISLYIDRIYNLYCKTLVRGNLQFLNKKVICQWAPPSNNKHYNFWHIISSEGSIPGEENRDVCFRRCERLGWIHAIISNYLNIEEILCWHSVRKSKVYTLLYLYRERYVVILRENKDYFQLTTAYPVENERRHKKFLVEYAAYAAINSDPRKSKGRP